MAGGQRWYRDVMARYYAARRAAGIRPGFVSRVFVKSQTYGAELRTQKG